MCLTPFHIEMNGKQNLVLLCHNPVNHQDSLTKAAKWDERTVAFSKKWHIYTNVCCVLHYEAGDVTVASFRANLLGLTWSLYLYNFNHLHCFLHKMYDMKSWLLLKWTHISVGTPDLVNRSVYHCSTSSLILYSMLHIYMDMCQIYLCIYPPACMSQCVIRLT